MKLVFLLMVLIGLAGIGLLAIKSGNWNAGVASILLGIANYLLLSQ